MLGLWSALAAGLCLTWSACERAPAPPPPAAVTIDAGVVAAPVPPGLPSAVTRVKNLLVGLAADEAEVQAVANDHAALATLVRSWMQRPEYRAKMLNFFATEFQQNDWVYSDLQYQFCSYIPFSRSKSEFMDNMQQSFARTVLELIDEGEPFHSAFTTTRFMMTPALMAAHALIDDVRVDDRYVCDLRKLPFSITVTAGPAGTLEQALDPKSATFRTFRGSGSAQLPQGSPLNVLTDLLFNQGVAVTADPCPSETSSATYLLESDFTDWKMVTIRPPQPNEALTPSYDLPAMRTRSRLILETPRVGFFSTPAFAARWPTNKSNQHRVTINQAMIAALGKPIDLSNVTKPQHLTALDTVHASAETDCYSCHQSLDPMRQFFQQTYTQSFGLQRDPNRSGVPGEFAFHGVSQTGTDIASFGRLLASHPLFAAAWVQKLCTWATSTVCDESTPEFRRLVAVFESSHYSWNALVVALFTSPLVFDLGTVPSLVSLARQEHLCATLSARLGVEDVCALETPTLASRTARGAQGRPAGWSALTSLDAVSPALQCLFTDNLRTSLKVARGIAHSWPADQYSRGSAARSLVTSPSLLTRGGLESLCANLADRFVDTDATSLFLSSDPARALDNLVTRLMGLTPVRAAVPRAILNDHFAETRRRGASSAVALKSTFVLACLTPYVAGLGE